MVYVEPVRTILLSQSVFENNDREAEKLRDELTAKGVLLINVMSSPGAGKTTALIGLIRRLKERYRIAVLEADIDSTVDAVSVAKETGCPAVQLHTDGMCHLDAGMTRQGLDALELDRLDLIFLENVGNLVCPAEYETGAQLSITILSVPEGDDKPLKYPLIYEKCSLVLINKTDTLPYFDFDMEACKRNIGFRNPHAAVIPVSARTGENMDQAAQYISAAVEQCKERGKCPNKTI